MLFGVFAPGRGWRLESRCHRDSGAGTLRQIVYIVSQVIWSASSERSVCTYCYEEEYECRARRTRRLRDAHHAQKPDSLVVEYMHGVHVVSYLQKFIYHSSGRTILPDWEQQEHSDLTACARRVKVSQSWCILLLPKTFVKPVVCSRSSSPSRTPGCLSRRPWAPLCICSSNGQHRTCA